MKGLEVSAASTRMPRSAIAEGVAVGRLGRMGRLQVRKEAPRFRLRLTIHLKKKPRNSRRVRGFD
jgi:hypothetical protein